jgi:hypothetical protein
MDKIAEDENALTLRFSRTEFVIVNNSLNEVSHLIRIPETEFEDRLGAPRTETKRLLDAVRGAEGMTVQFSVAELTLLRNAMIEVTKGQEIEEWEYPIRLGVAVAEGEQLLAEVEDLIEATAA